MPAATAATATATNAAPTSLLLLPLWRKDDRDQGGLQRRAGRASPDSSGLLLLLTGICRNQAHRLHVARHQVDAAVLPGLQIGALNIAAIATAQSAAADADPETPHVAAQRRQQRRQGESSESSPLLLCCIAPMLCRKWKASGRPQRLMWMMSSAIEGDTQGVPQVGCTQAHVGEGGYWGSGLVIADAHARTHKWQLGLNCISAQRERDSI